MEYEVRPSSTSHELLNGVEAWSMKEEVYLFPETVEKACGIIMETDCEESSSPLCWTGKCGKSLTVCIAPGHAPSAYKNRNFRKLLSNAIDYSEIDS